LVVPNSASVYNRKGEAVHEWKGNHGGPEGSAYLNDDGSLTRNAEDPDFPVFAGGGEGRLQKNYMETIKYYGLLNTNEASSHIMI